MPLSAQLHTALKAELKSRRITYADVAEKLSVSEATIKRDFSRSTLSLERFGEICDAYAIGVDELAQRLSAQTHQLTELTDAQERAIVANPKLWLVSICALNQWSFDEIVERYALKPAEVTQHLLTLDKMGILELHAENRIRLKLARHFRWRTDGPFMQTFRAVLASEYFDASFNDAPETFRLVIGTLTPESVERIRERLLALAADIAAHHAQDRRAPRNKKQAYTVALALRSWEPRIFANMKKAPKTA
jgi:transcriptional regulator with XRE-family HTH domain